MPTDPNQDKPLTDSQADSASLPGFELPSDGDIGFGTLESQAGFSFPSADMPPAAEPVAESGSGDTGLPTVSVPSEGDIDLGALGSRVEDEIPPAALTQKAPLPIPDSQAGQSALPRFDLPSQGDIDLASMESQAGDDIPMAAFPDPAPPALPDSQAGLSLARFDLPSEGDIDLGALESRAAEEIPLASLPEPPSGQSLTSWTEVIRRQRAAAQAGQASASDVRVDAPSDQDILIRFDETGPRRRTGDTSEILPGDLPVYTAPSGRSESDVDLGRPGLDEGTGESEVRFDVLYPPSDAAGAMPAPGPAAPLSEVDFRLATPADTPSASGIPFAALVDPAVGSGVNLGADTGPAGDGGRSSILDALLQDPAGPPRGGSSASVLDFGRSSIRPPAKQTVPNAASGPDRPAVPTRPNIDMGSQGSLPDVSGRNLVDPDRSSEEVIDLYAEPAPAPNITDSGTLEVSREALESQRRTEAQESSSIDLSSRPSYGGNEFDKALEAPAEDDYPSDSDIDLNLPPIGEDGDSSMIHRGAVEVDRDALAAEFKARREAREQAEKASKKPRKEVVPARDDEGGSSRGRGGALLAGSVLGLLLGAGAVLGAYFAGVLPNRGPAAKGPPVAAADNSAELARLKQDADAARQEAVAARADVARQVEEARKAGANQIRMLTDAKTAADTEIQRLAGEAQKSQTELTAARKMTDDAKAAEQVATNNLAAAKKAADDAQKEMAAAVAARKAADDSLAALNKTLADAGLDPAKPGDTLKRLVADRTAAEARAKDAEAKVKAADTKLAETSKKVTDLTAVAETARKSADDARKAADEAARARDASAATVKAVADRLAQAKFVGDKADAAAILKGIDAAVKAGSGDATRALRDELTKARADEEKAKADLAAAREKEAALAKAATDAKAEAQKARTELTRLAAETAKLKQDATDAVARATAAEKAATQGRQAAEAAQAEARAATERSATEVARLRAETDRLTRDLAAVKELAELIKTPAGTTEGPTSKPDPDQLAEEFYGDGLRAFYRGRNTEAESAFRKAIQFRPNDARYHYLLGLTLWARKETAGAEAEFAKGRDLELAGRPSSRVISAALERIQGPARQAVDAYRP